MSDVWRPILGWEGFYEVSSTGKVRSIHRSYARSDGKVYTYRGSIKAQTVSPYGYLRVRLVHRTAGRSETLSAHRAVALAFVANPKFLESVNHIDGNKLNNAACNLEWATRGDNSRHGWRSGLMAEPKKGEAHSNSKLTDAQAGEIRIADIPRGTLRAFAQGYGVSIDTVQLIRKGFRYRVVK